VLTVLYIRQTILGSDQGRVAFQHPAKTQPHYPINMQRTIQTLRKPCRLSKLQPTIHLRTAATTAAGRPEGTIADAFASLSGQNFEALEPRFATVKETLIRGNEKAVKASWDRLLLTLNNEIREIRQLGSSVVPQIDFGDIDTPSEQFNREYRKRGVAVIKGVVPEDEALQMKADVREYIRANPQTKSQWFLGFAKAYASKLTSLHRLLIASI
jgi:hypothetical protein